MKSETRQRWLIMLTAAALLLFLVDRFGLGPLTALWKKRTAHIAELKANLESGRTMLAREKVVRERWGEIRGNTLPYNSSAAEQQLFKALDGWAQESHAKCTGITPQWKEDAEDYMTMDCRVEAAGSMEALSRFLFEIERSPLALQLQSVELASHDGAGRELVLALRCSALALAPEETKP